MPTMTLTVPYRGAGAQQTSAVIIELEPTVIAAGASIDVTGLPSPLVVPAATCASADCLKSTAAGDDVEVSRIAAPDRVRLTFNLHGSFTGDFCSASTSDAIAGRTFSIATTGLTFPAAGVGASVSYRITSLMPPGDSSCNFGYVRVPSNRPFLSIAAPDSLDKLGRFPLSLMLVLDKSGSMGWGLPLNPAQSRWERLQDAVEAFSNTWGVLGFTGAEDGHPQDQVGLVFFDSNAAVHNLGGAGTFLARGVAANPWTAALTAAMAPPTTPGGLTAIGDGIAKARLQLDTVDAIAGDTAIILFTDGEQNRSPCVLHEGETTVSGCNVAVGADPDTAQLVLAGSADYPPAPTAPLLVQGLGPRGPIFTIGLGEDATHASGQLLDEISVETAGTGWFPVNGLALDAAFTESLVNLLQGGTVSRLTALIGSMPAAAAGTAPLPVAIDPSLGRVVFVVGWEQPDAEIDLELTQPDGTPVVPLQVERGRRSLVARIDLPASGPSGTWHARLSNGNQAPPTAVFPPIEVRLAAYGVETRLSFRVTESRRVGTDGPLSIIAELGWDGEGLADLAAGGLTVFIERPGENLGDILHDTATKSVDPAFDQSPLGAKLAELVATGKLLERIAPRPVDGGVPLKHVGLGRYEGSLDGVEVGGQYGIRVDFDWDDPRTGPIHREQPAERHAIVVPTAEATTVAQQRRGELGIGLQITPRDRFGNYVGPGYAGHFSVLIDGRPLTEPLADPGLTGDYLLDLSALPPGSDPRIEIRYRGKTLRDAPLSKVEAPPGGPTGRQLPWWVWLVLTLILLLLWLLFR